MKQKLILLALVMGLTIVSQSSLSLGMGKIQVYSALNEPLQSSIDLLANADEELLNLEVKLASSEDYQKVGLDRSFVPANIMVAFDEENPYQINVTSNGPVSEPIVSLLLDVNWSNGRILREFTVLLDPPVYESVNTSAQVNNVVVEPLQENVINEPIVDPSEVSDSEPELQSRDEQTPTITNDDFDQYEDQSEVVETEESIAEVDSTSDYSNSSAAEVYVEAGDTLWRIANNNKVGELSAQQMMIAIYNKNPDAFIDNNINKLIKGSRLDMPSIDEASNIGFSEALAQVESHHQSWSPAQQDYSTYQTEDTVEETYQTPEANLDYGVQLSGGDNEGSDQGQSNSDVGSDSDAMAIEEDLYNKDAENTDLKERISELEDIVEQQQDAIEISDDSLANLENQLDNTADDLNDETNQLVDETAAAVDDVWDEATNDFENVVDEVSDELNLSVDATEAVTDELDDGGIDNTDYDTEDSDSGVEADDSDNTVTDVEQSDAEQTTAETTPVAPQKFTPPQQESLVDSTINWVMDNLMWVLIGVVALIVLLFLPKMLRGSDDDDDDETSFLDDIKNRKTKADEDEIDGTDTKLNQPLDIDDDSADDEIDSDNEGDVLAELDRSIDFDDVEVEVEEAVADIENNDELTELNETGEFESVDDDGFDLDGFLNDDDNDDITVTKDHASTLAGVSFDDAEDDESSTEVEFSDDDMSFDDLDLSLDDDIEELTDEVEEAADELKAEVEEAVDEAAEEIADEAIEVAEEVKDETDDFSFDDDEDFDFDLEEELEELEQTEDIETAEADDSEDFNDMLDISDESAETFETNDGEAGMDEEIDLGLEDLMDDTDAIDTKLDLAKAYIDMGDAEGAKNLLDEIYAEGTEEQIAAAKKLLDDM